MTCQLPKRALVGWLNVSEAQQLIECSISRDPASGVDPAAYDVLVLRAQDADRAVIAKHGRVDVGGGVDIDAAHQLPGFRLIVAAGLVEGPPTRCRGIFLTFPYFRYAKVGIKLKFLGF
jgi:hypothetical protein